MGHLGDPHNFGKRVALTAEGLISKPRNLFWEWLFLSSHSPLRHFIEDIATSKGLPSPFRSFPDLTFTAPSLIDGGTVTRLELSPLSDADLSPEFYESVGATIGLVTAMGIADLHRQNMAIGTASNGRPVFAPLDIESALETYTLPSQTHLLPSAEVPSELCGLSGLLPYLRTSVDSGNAPAVAALARGYLTTIDLLVEHDSALSDLLAAHADFERAPVRVFLRATRQYYAWLNQTGAVFETPLEPTEWEQLKRGDIPYFVRQLESTEVLYFKTPDQPAPAELSPALTGRGLSNSVPFPKGKPPQLFADPKKRSELLKAGVLQLVRFCDDKQSVGHFDHEDVVCEFSAGEIFVTWRDKLKVKCARK